MLSLFCLLDVQISNYNNSFQFFADRESRFLERVKLNIDDYAAIFNENELLAFIQGLGLLPKTDLYKKFAFNAAFPLIYGDVIEFSLTSLLERLQPDTLLNASKENQPLLVTAAPTGSGKVCTRQFDEH